MGALPPNACATLIMPTIAAAEIATVQESGRTVWASGVFVPGVPGITSGSLGTGDDCVVFEIGSSGSGSYAFTAQ